MLEVVAVACLVLASVPATLVLVNLPFYRRPSAAAPARLGSVSVLIPARDEQDSIRAAVESVRSQSGIDLEVVVLDDGSTDRTAEIVREIQRADSRVRLERAPALPRGWCGKQHACMVLSRLATHPNLVFMDADVRLAPGGLARILSELDHRSADLISGIPRQRAETLAERLVIPLIHFVLLGYLPMVGVRFSRSSAFAAGCGQLMAVRREAYEAVGGHAAIRSSRHDGITLPRSFRQAARRTDLFDATYVASCRMYRSGRDVWHGFAKNATEGMASRGAILPWTVLLLGGHVAPWLLLPVTFAWESPAAVFVASAIAVAYATRVALALRFRQSWVGAILHPIGVAMIVAIQWYARFRLLGGRQVAWKGRVHRAA